MKMLRFMAVAMACAACRTVPAQEATSVNAVGSIKRTLPPGKMILAGFNWLQLDGGTNGLLPREIVSTNSVTGGDSALTADNLILWNRDAQAYRTYFLVDGFGPPYDGKWYDVNTFAECTNRIRHGDGFWLRSNQSTTQEVTFTGEVPAFTSGTNTMLLEEGLNMFTYPFSAGILVNTNNMLYENAKGGDSALTADNLILWNVDRQAYETYFMVKGFGPDYDNRWYDVNTFALCTNSLDVGVGAWYRRLSGESTMSWNEPQPYDLD